MHIMSNCKTALTQGRYSWRHDSVLKCMEPALLSHIKSFNESKLQKTPKKLIKFVKKGEKGSAVSFPPHHLLSAARDWQCLIDFKDNSYVFPTVICITNLRPDIVIWSLSLKKVILLELTCPLEENIVQAKARKSARYLPLLNLIKDSGWTATLLLMEAGVRGCLSFSFAQSLRNLGIAKTVTKQVCKNVEKVVNRCSYIIFNAHRQKIWTWQHLFTIR